MKRFLPVIFVIAVTMIAALWSRPPEEVTYQGKTVEEWSFLLDRHQDQLQREAVIDRLRGDANAVPLLLALTKQRQHHYTMAELFNHLKPDSLPLLIKHLSDGDSGEASWCAFTISRFGSQSESAIDALIDHIKNSNGNEIFRSISSSKEALIRIGPPAIDELIPLLEDDDLSALSSEILSEYGYHSLPYLTETEFRSREAREVASSLAIKIRSEEDWLVSHYKNFEAYGRLEKEFLRETVQRRDGMSEETLKELKIEGMTVEEAVRELISRLDDPNTIDGRQAIRWLGWFGPLASPATPKLIELLEQREQEDITLLVTGTLASIGPQAEEAVPILIEKFKSADSRSSKVRMAQALSSIGRPAPELVPGLLQIMEDDSPLVFSPREVERWRGDAAIALARVAPSEAVPHLIDRLDEPVWTIRRAYIEALAVVGPEAIPALIEALSNPDPQVRDAAAVALVKIGHTSQLANIALGEYDGPSDTTISWAAEECRRQFRLLASNS